jgi:hypothetical protein
VKATIFDKIYNQIMEDTTSTAFGPNSELYTNLGAPNADVYAPGDARVAKVLSKKKKISRRTFPETVFLTGKQKKSKNNG